MRLGAHGWGFTPDAQDLPHVAQTHGARPEPGVRIRVAAALLDEHGRQREAGTLTPFWVA